MSALQKLMIILFLSLVCITNLSAKEDVEQNNIMLTGVNNYTKRGISFGLSFFVKATTEEGYSEIRHRIITEIAKIIKDTGIALVMIRQENIPDGNS